MVDLKAWSHFVRKVNTSSLHLVLFISVGLLVVKNVCTAVWKPQLCFNTVVEMFRTKGNKKLDQIWIFLHSNLEKCSGHGQQVTETHATLLLTILNDGECF